MLWQRRSAAFALGLLFATQAAHAQQVAFPGAEGAGRFTTGGRGTASAPTTVFEVTNLNDDNNPGSLRYALSQPAAARTIVFRVSGTVHLASPLKINKANTTLAGQTAPGNGICIADFPMSLSANNLIVRYMRFRLGDRNQNKGMVDGSGNDDAFGGLNVSNIIVDHCSISWSSDEAFTIYGGDNITAQWNIISEPLNYSYHYETGDTDFERHGYGGIWGGQHATFHHNLIAHCLSRTPRFNGSRYGVAMGYENVDFRNNVIYNWGNNNVYGGEAGNYNVVNNYYKYGPSTSNSVRYRVLNPYKQTSPALPYGQFYMTGNYVDGSPLHTADNWKGVVMQGGSLADTTKAKAATPFDLGPVTTQTATVAYEAVLAGAGAMLPRRDTLDQRIVNNVRTRTGRIIDVQGGYPHGTPYSISQHAWPALNSLPASIDSDHDGMPDAWERSQGSNPNDASDRNEVASNGYTRLENYLNSLALTVTGTKSAKSSSMLLQAYPNPTEDQLTIEHPAAGRGASIAIFSVLGGKLKGSVSTLGTRQTQLDLHSLTSGSYLVQYTDEHTHLTTRFVKQ
ncbi:T9SS type A sorting domain-containing protein [Hymenobacter aerilatus]|uniref:T9SS type A sorting domain-containing protein n=1 Tax=Hymenobacter aerilatus TaxID=2932251 RepID=A0A8T9SND6_9BACT|nr:T9SS type A sorting domain-containing protein [Hymenobacter aerilatus]UOR03628.1 T9SS type A sorting domain-containing protein [Hymenobacter aerilatus]